MQNTIYILNKYSQTVAYSSDNPDNIAAYLLGKTLHNYIVFKVGQVAFDLDDINCADMLQFKTFLRDYAAQDKRYVITELVP